MSMGNLFDFERLISQRFEARLDENYEAKKDLGRNFVNDLISDTEEQGLERISRIGQRLAEANARNADPLEIAAIETVLKNCQARAARRN